MSVRHHLPSTVILPAAERAPLAELQRALGGVTLAQYQRWLGRKGLPGPDQKGVVNVERVHAWLLARNVNVERADR